MKHKTYLKQYLIYTAIFIPTILLGIEIILTSFSLLRGVNVRKKTTRFDIINGWNGIPNQEELFNKHGLVKTPYVTDREKFPNEEGILISGNSVTMGYPMLSKDYRKTFVNQLETSLRKDKAKIDIVNISMNAYNSWQEHVETSRYLNSYKNHNDLPNIEKIVSIGGVQDFQSLIDLLYKTKNRSHQDYYKANGLMTWSQGKDDFAKNVDESSKGNIKSSLNIFISSLVNNSKINHYVGLVKYKLYKNRLNKIGSVKTSNKEYSKFRNINQILLEEFNLTISDNRKVRDLVIDSVLRNLVSSASISKEKKIVYIYLPSRFSSFLTKKNSDKNLFVWGEKNSDVYLNIRDFHVLEKDFRKSFFNKLSTIKSIQSFDISNEGKDSWYTDVSHYSLEGHNQIAILIEKIFFEFLYKKNDLKAS